MHFPLDGHLLLVSLTGEREREARRNVEKEGKGKEEREEMKERAFFSVALWLIPYTANVRDGEW